MCIYMYITYLNLFFSQVHQGVSGSVYAPSMAPVSKARIATLPSLMDVYTATSGDYFRILVPGNYTLTVSAHGFKEQSQVLH